VLPPAWALSYERISRFGLLIIYALLFLGGPVLTWWLFPAIAGTRFLVGISIGFLLPGVGGL
jgi:hypothetical protein